MIDDSADVITAYRLGATADFLRAKVEGRWGVIWTVPPCSPNALERAGRQFARSRAEAVRHYRRARLRTAAGIRQEVVILTVLPGRLQQVRDMEAGDVLVAGVLIDDALIALENGLGLSTG